MKSFFFQPRQGASLLAAHLDIQEDQRDARFLMQPDVGGLLGGGLLLGEEGAASQEKDEQQAREGRPSWWCGTHYGMSFRRSSNNPVEPGIPVGQVVWV
ncbi:MAG: hypothetical protein ACE5HD_12345 [Acidobacteriota bacterium]